MKKLAYFAIAALAFAACQKAVDNTTPLPATGTHMETIHAGLVETRTAYDDAGIFSWAEGDVIGVMYIDDTGNIAQIPFTAAAAGPEAEFTGEVQDNYVPMGMASYPFTEAYDGYARNDFAYSAEGENNGLRLWGSIKPDAQNPLSCTPLIAKAGDDGFYQFRTATGIVKFTVENVPAEMAYSYLETPAESEAFLNGWFFLGDDVSIEMKNATSGYHDRYNWNTPSGPNETMDIYFFLPVGTLPAGTKFELCNSNWAAIESFTFAKDVEVVRNAIVEVAPIVLEPVQILTLDDLLGEYEMTIFSAGPYSGGYAEPGDIVLEASDDSSKGNVMMTKFAGISGKQYGTFDGIKVVFPKDQIFGPNPFEDADTKPYVALDFYKGGVVDAAFELVSRGKIKAVDADVFGLRSCTEEDWQTYGGGWPWVLSFSTITAEWKGSGSGGAYVKGEEIPLKLSMIYACNSISWDGQGVAGLIDDDPSTYWHSDYYYPITDNDPVYGIYFDITLEQEIDSFQFKYQVRANNAGARPTHFVYGISADGVNWTPAGEAATEEMTGAKAGDWVTVPAVAPGSPFKFLRLGITDSASGDEGSLTGDLNFDGYKKCVNMAELKLFWAE
ncbi:MAG: discoidin domain-containing protein [Bacteroidales bacterium]|nr:discoidin domain-containing protein [Bacteroidales bacterium]